MLQGTAYDEKMNLRKVKTAVRPGRKWCVTKVLERQSINQLTVDWATVLAERRAKASGENGYIVSVTELPGYVAKYSNDL